MFFILECTLFSSVHYTHCVLSVQYSQCTLLAFTLFLSVSPVLQCMSSPCIDVFSHFLRNIGRLYDLLRCKIVSISTGIIESFLLCISLWYVMIFLSKGKMHFLSTSLQWNRFFLLE